MVCVLEQLHRALQRRDVFASPSHRWSDPRPAAGRHPVGAVREDILAGLNSDMKFRRWVGEYGGLPGVRVNLVDEEIGSVPASWPDER
ncbi:hypothetical protein GTY54_24905 [Streptomyces sp. SID625]|nr:hypothetical protein [Streptomyces sp. SID625]